MAYGATTSIPLSRSLSDLETLIRKAGFGGFAQGAADDRLLVGFANSNGRQVRFIVPVREIGPELFEHMLAISRKTGGKRPTSHEEAWQQHRRQLGRALLLTVKAKIECIEAGIETFEDAFMSQLSLPDGRTVGAMVKAEIAIAYSGGKTPPALLPDYSSPDGAGERG